MSVFLSKENLKGTSHSTNISTSHPSSRNLFHPPHCMRTLMTKLFHYKYLATACECHHISLQHSCTKNKSKVFNTQDHQFHHYCYSEGVSYTSYACSTFLMCVCVCETEDHYWPDFHWSVKHQTMCLCQFTSITEPFRNTGQKYTLLQLPIILCPLKMSAQWMIWDIPSGKTTIETITNSNGFNGIYNRNCNGLCGRSLLVMWWLLLVEFYLANGNWKNIIHL